MGNKAETDGEQLLHYYKNTIDSLKPAVMASAKAAYQASKAIVDKKQHSP